MSQADDRRPQDADEFKGRTGQGGRHLRLVIPAVILVVILAAIGYLLAVGHVV